MLNKTYTLALIQGLAYMGQAISMDQMEQSAPIVNIEGDVLGDIVVTVGGTIDCGGDDIIEVDCDFEYTVHEFGF